MESHVNLFRPIENPRRLTCCSWDYRWFQGTGNKPFDDTSERVLHRYYKKEDHWKNQHGKASKL